MKIIPQLRILVKYLGFRVYTPLKMATKCNCSGNADPVLVSVEESLNTGKLAALAQKQARQERLAEILQKIQLQEHAPDDEFQPNYNRAVTRQAFLYYLAGYVVKKARKFTSCTDCINTLVDACHVPQAAIPTEMR